MLKRYGWKQITKSSTIKSNPISVEYRKNKIGLVVEWTIRFWNRNNNISFILP